MNSYILSVPYFCPKCDNKEFFQTIEDLEKHLKEIHFSSSSKSTVLAGTSSFSSSDLSEFQNSNERFNYKPSSSLEEETFQIPKKLNEQIDILNRDLQKLNLKQEQLQNVIEKIEIYKGTDPAIISMLMEKLYEKDSVISSKMSEVDRLSEFLETLSEKDEQSRQKLEHYIIDLLERTILVENQSKQLAALLSEYHFKSRYLKHLPTSLDEHPNFAKIPGNRVTLAENPLNLDSSGILWDLSSTRVNYENNVQPIMQDLSDRQLALFRVFSYLDSSTLCIAGAVCREWYQISRLPDLWTSVVLKQQHISDKFLSTISAWCTQVRLLVLEGLLPRQMRYHETADEYKRDTRAHLEQGLRIFLQSNSATLVEVRIVYCDLVLTSRCLEVIGQYCHSLRRLAYVSDAESINEVAMLAIVSGCPKIKAVFLAPGSTRRPFVVTRGIELIVNWSNLTILGIGGSTVTGDMLKLLAHHCSHLTVLELDHAPFVDEDVAIATCTVGLQYLQVLDFLFTPVTSSALLCFANCCAHIQRIQVHLGISDYFPDTQNTGNVASYKEIINSFERLKKVPHLNKILRFVLTYD